MAQGGDAASCGSHRVCGWLSAVHARQLVMFAVTGLAMAALMVAGVAKAQPEGQAPAEPPRSAPPADGAQDTPPPEAPPAEAPPEAPPAAPPPHAKLAQAKRLFEEAESLRKAGQCEQAIPRYQRSRALVASVANTLNLALCLTAAGRADQALEIYTELIATQRAALTADELRTISPEMNRLRAELGTLDVVADIDAALVIDGRRRGTLPLATSIPLIPGSHDVRLLKDGFEPFLTAVDVRAGQITALRAALVPLSDAGRIEVSASDLVGAELFIDGAPVGSLPYAGAIAAGAHAWQVVRGTVGSAPALVTVRPGQTLLLRPVGTPLGAPLEIAATPLSARITLDGVVVGKGRWFGRLPVGRAVVEATEPGFTAARSELDIAIDDHAQRITLTLVKDADDARWAVTEPPGRFWIEAFGGLAVSPSLDGDAERSCATVVCNANPVATGVFAGLRAGYELPFRLSFEIGAGYLSLGKTVKRVLRDGFTAEGTLVTVDYALEDALILRGGFVTGGVGYRLVVSDPFELRAHVLLGVLFSRSGDTITGLAQGDTEAYAVSIQGSGTTQFGVNLMIGPELDFGIHVDNVTFGLGVSVAYVPLEAASSRLGVAVIDASCDATRPRSVACSPIERLVDGEIPHGGFLLIAPTARLGYRF